MKRKIVFVGCSFTWGQSLWMYEKEPKNIPCALEWTRFGYDIEEELIQTKDKYRFANLVCNELGNYEPITKLLNGGTDEESVRFVDLVLSNDLKDNTDRHLYKGETNPNDIDAIVFQTTQTYRSSYPFELNGKYYKIYSTPNMKNLSRVMEMRYNTDSKVGDETIYSTHVVENGMDIFVDFLISNNIKVEDFEKAHIKKWTNEIETVLKKYHEKGKKVFLLCWTDEYLEEINKNNFLKSIFVPLYYDNKKFDCINELYKYNEEMRIDKHIKNRYMGFDEHPSSICHQTISNSILKKWNLI